MTKINKEKTAEEVCEMIRSFISKNFELKDFDFIITVIGRTLDNKIVIASARTINREFALNVLERVMEGLNDPENEATRVGAIQ
jgi:hypothetical protein